MMGTKTLMQILQQKEEMAKLMKETLDDATDAWGIRVEMIEVENVFKKPRQVTSANLKRATTR